MNAPTTFDFSAAIKSGPSTKAPRILIVGVEGVGKSTFGAACDSPIFLCSEDGLIGKGFDGVNHFAPRTWAEAMDFVSWLSDPKNAHGFKTLVLDTLDWLEPMLFKAICQRDSKGSVEDYGYGKGYVIASEEYRGLLARIEKLHRDRGMMIVMCAHCQIKAFNNPVGDNYDRYELKVCKQIAGMTKEWVDAVLFARFEDMAYKESQKSKAKGIGTGKRIVHTTHSAAWDAKNRYSLPETLPLDAVEILKAITDGQPDSAENIASEITELAESLPDEKKKAALDYVDKNKTNTTKLAQMLNRIRSAASSERQVS